MEAPPTPELDSWHPIRNAEEVGRRPVPVRVLGRELVLFRTSEGRLGALEDRCPHRGMRLSCGKVTDSQLVCPYHGWAWAIDGHGKSPTNPSLEPRATHYDVTEAYGVIWIKNAGSDAKLPHIDTEGMRPISRSRGRYPVPLELAVDNFQEVEHTGPVHLWFGYDEAQLPNVEIDWSADEDTVRVSTSGAQKKIPWVLRLLVGFPKQTTFVDHWTTRFSPVHSVYDQHWLDAQTKRAIDLKLRVAVFFTPIDDEQTDVYAIGFVGGPRTKVPLLGALIGFAFSAAGRFEMWIEARLLKRMADTSVEIRGNLLGRFDAVLMAVRRNVDRLYRGYGRSLTAPRRSEMRVKSAQATEVRRSGSD